MLLWLQDPLFTRMHSSLAGLLRCACKPIFPAASYRLVSSFGGDSFPLLSRSQNFQVGLELARTGKTIWTLVWAQWDFTRALPGVRVGRSPTKPVCILLEKHEASVLC